MSPILLAILLFSFAIPFGSRFVRFVLRAPALAWDLFESFLERYFPPELEPLRLDPAWIVSYYRRQNAEVFA